MFDSGVNSGASGPKPNLKPGFTLVELLVVITIIGILIALLLPAVQAAREAARRMQCTNNLKQMGLALHMYHDTQKTFPYGYSAVMGMGLQGGNYHLGFGTLILPYMEQRPLFEEFDLRYGYNTVQHAPLIKQQIAAYHCPSTSAEALVTCCIYIPGHEDAAQTNYLGVGTHTDSFQTTSGSGMLYCNSGVRIAHVGDGTSQTLMLSEVITYADDDPHKDNTSYCPDRACTVGAAWAGSGTLTTYYGINGQPTSQQRGVQSKHPGGANFTFADGHVSFLAESINQEALNRLTTRDGGDVIHNFDY